jgi:transposase
VLKGYRTTQRFRRHIRWACERFADLKSVSTTYRVSSGFVYSAHYAELEHRRKSRQYPWPSTVALDEHYFKKGPHGGREFVSMVVDYKNKRLFELVEGRRVEQMKHSLKHIEGRDNVKTVVMDMYEPYRAFTKDFFPAATIVADKFHVLRLLSPTINKRRKEITGDKRKHPIRWMLLTNNRKLSRDHRAALFRWLEDKPGIRELYQLKEALHRLYRIRGYDRAKKALGKLMDTMALSKQPEVKTLRNTLKKWTSEILAYFKIRVTNGRTEGYNSKAKLVKKRAYGYKSFNNYRLRLLNACA